MSKQKRSADEMRRMVEEFQGSGLTRRDFCERHDIAITTLDYWRHAQSGPARLVKVEVAASESASGFTLSLANGRRIESQWNFGEAELARLIRVAESV
jgi:transposase-like protein